MLPMNCPREDRKVPAAELLGRLTDAVERLGQVAHQEHGQHAGADQHQAGRQQEVGAEPRHKRLQHLARGADKEVGPRPAVPAQDGPCRNVKPLVKGAAQPAHLVVDPAALAGGFGYLLQQRGGHRLAGQVVAVGRQDHPARAVGEKEVDVGALADQVHLPEDGLQPGAGFFVLGFQAVPHIGGGAGGEVADIVQGGKALLRKVPAEKHQLGQAHDGHSQDHQSGHGGKEGHRDTFAHY